ncbi:MAG TPA: hypothetical protein PKA90_15045 [Ignavibacteria bacterium]|nr:hypothetical protein [Ignavibacteria bacterium]HMR41734.1 hypothetical protein [Ignavibacteria bacterium]
MKKKSLKFFQLYNTLLPSEKREFFCFLNLSFTPKIKIAKSVISHISPEEDFEKYLRSSFSEQTVWNICSELSKALEKFLAVKELLESDTIVYRLFLKQIDKRDLQSLSMQVCKKEIHMLLESKLESGTFRNIAEISHEYLRMAIKAGNVKLQKELYITYNSFITFAIMTELLMEMESNIVTGSIGKESEMTLLEHLGYSINFEVVLNHIEEKYPGHYNILRLIYDLYNLIRTNFCFISYNKTKDLFFTLMDRFSDKLKTDLFDSLIDCLINTKEKNGNNVDKELFELFDKKLEAGLFRDLSVSKIGFNRFRDNVLIALNVEEIDWAEDFVKRYSYLLPENQKSNDVITSHALISLKKKNYREAINHIKKVNKSYYIHYNDYFRISIKANFELGLDEECFSLLEKYHDYIRKADNLSSKYVTGSRSFIKNVKNLIKYRFDLNKIYLIDIEMELAKKVPLSDIVWIESIYEKLSGKKIVEKAV